MFRVCSSIAVRYAIIVTQNMSILRFYPGPQRAPNIMIYDYIKSSTTTIVVRIPHLFQRFFYYNGSIHRTKCAIHCVMIVCAVHGRLYTGISYLRTAFCLVTFSKILF